MNSCCIYTGVCGVECSGKGTDVDINSCKVAKEIDKLIDRIQNLKREKEKYYQMTLDDEIQINELFGENTELKEKLEKIKKVILRCKEANCTNCEYQAKCNFNGDDFDDFLLRIIEGAEDDK